MSRWVKYDFNGREGNFQVPRHISVDNTVGWEKAKSSNTVVGLCHRYNFFNSRSCKFGSQCRYVHIPHCRRVINGCEGCDVYTDSSSDDDDDDDDYSDSDSRSTSESDGVDYFNGHHLGDVDLIFDFAGAVGQLPASDFHPTVGRAWSLEHRAGRPNSTYSRPVCRNFAFSQCGRNDDCRFLHPLDIDLAQNVANGQSRAAVLMGRQRLADSTAKRERERQQQTAREHREFLERERAERQRESQDLLRRRQQQQQQQQQQRQQQQQAHASFQHEQQQHYAYRDYSFAPSSHANRESDTRRFQKFTSTNFRSNPSCDERTGAFGFRNVKSRGRRPEYQSVRFARDLASYTMPSELARFVPRNKAEAMNIGLIRAADVLCKNLLSNTAATLVNANDQLHLVESGLLHPASRELNNCPRPLLRLHAQLWAEEAKCAADLLSFAKEGAIITQMRNSTHFMVPAEGVAEKRPSVLRGDSIHVRLTGSNSDHWDAGYVYFVNADGVVVDFSPNSTVATILSRNPNGAAFDVVFCEENRTQWRMLHRAVDEGAFLNLDAIQNLNKPSNLRIRNDQADHLRKNMQRLKLNVEQGTFVDNLIRPRDNLGETRGLHIIHGPPGTGKTSTCCAALAALLSVYSNVKILVCCPSNAAADLIVERLADYPIIHDCNISMRRVHALARCDKETSAKVNLFSDLDGAGGYIFPSGASSLQPHSVIVTTLATAGKLYGIGIPTDYFTHVFVDEAGQATESQMMLATTFLKNQRTAFILAGDHLQLGPVIHSSPCKEVGMHVSPLERFCMTLPEKYITLLVNNYRSHPDILRIVNVPYKDKLKAARHIPQGWQPSYLSPKLGVLSSWPDANIYAPRPWKSPLLFCHIEGRETREANSPSWKNMEEISCVVGLVKYLINEHKEDPRDIAILTPYLLQRTSIDQALYGGFHNAKTINLRDPNCAFHPNGKLKNPVEVATIEAFQGKERKIVIVSCVRSRKEEVEKDVRHFLGFMSQPNRSNVALSRAQDLLIVVGNAKLLLTEGMRRLTEAPKERREGGHIHFGGAGNWNIVMERFLEMGAVVNVENPNTAPEELFRKAFEMAHEAERKREQKRQQDEARARASQWTHADPMNMPNNNNNNRNGNDDDDDDSDGDEVVQSQAPLMQLE